MVDPVETPPRDPDPVVEPVETPPRVTAEPVTGEPTRRRRRRRRVTTEAPPGTDPAPPSEPPRHALDENDQRLREDKPPHY